MASLGGASSEGQATNAWIREVPMREMADQLGIPELPMRQPAFDFYAHAVYHLKQMGFSGQELYHVAHEVIQTLFYNISKGTKGPVYKYVNWYEKQIADGIKPSPFDEYFKYAFRQKAFTARKKSLNQKKKQERDLSIQEGWTMEDEFLADTKTPGAEEISSEKEESKKREEVFEEIPKMLAKHRLGDKYAYIWAMMRKNYKLAEIAEELNELGISSPSGKEWGTGSVYKVRDQIYRLVKEFLESYGIDWHSIIASRKGFRFGLVFER
jgi:hypothetical protein